MPKQSNGNSMPDGILWKNYIFKINIPESVVQTFKLNTNLIGNMCFQHSINSLHILRNKSKKLKKNDIEQVKALEI